MKTLKQLLEKAPPKGYEPKSKDEKRFVDKHVVAKTADANGNKDDVFKATNVKAVDRNQEGHGYNPGDDEAVYEQAEIVEKTLTAAEKSKREEVAKAIERENPGIDKSKKMAIATATAKRVAEESEHDLIEGEIAHAQYQKYHSETKKMLDNIGKGLDMHHKNITSKAGYNGGVPHWGHVEDIKSYHRQLQDLHDRVLQQGEYSKPAQLKKEGTELTGREVLGEEEYDRIRDLYGKSAARSMSYSRWNKHHPDYGKTSSQTKPASSSSDPSKIYHKVPFAQKDDAKKEGMKWDSGAKKWYHSSAAASSSSKFRKEEAEHDEENQIVEFINSFYEQLDADNQRLFEELAAEQDIEQILEMIDQVLAED